MIVPLCLAVAAISDLLTMTIPNRVPAILLGAFILVAPLAGLSLPMIGMHVAAGLIVFAVCFALFAMNVMGGGDAKLLTASAVWFGLNSSLMEFLVYVSFLGGILTLLILMMRKRRMQSLHPDFRFRICCSRPRKLPYGVAIGFGGFLAYPSSPLMVAALAHLH